MNALRLQETEKIRGRHSKPEMPAPVSSLLIYDEAVLLVSLQALLRLEELQKISSSGAFRLVRLRVLYQANRIGDVAGQGAVIDPETLQQFKSRFHAAAKVFRSVQTDPAHREAAHSGVGTGFLDDAGIGDTVKLNVGLRHGSAGKEPGNHQGGK